ncbi:2'-5' RNA ligase family protein [Amycolatopsis sp. H20-H5]|uniref:2'-5' RNA ligase family protein n=1 Tax=Amycolatopsis sp. H20-H5 TaxID=3046309 RepID=UPI002DBA3999|nr:hypothetical protein [Amycolatopsis sp. H20-H5]MEC3982500.1 hypothetical protein [Amycolatopsis sp. H20-H5]
MRLSFALRLPPEVTAVVAAMTRPPLENVQWTDPRRWIVKLRPLGHVPSALHQLLVDAVEADLDGAVPLRVSFGPIVRRYGGQQLSAPVEGLEELAAAVFDATVPLVPVTHPQPVHTDLVLAGGRVPAQLAGTELRAEWVVDELLLIADRSSPRAVRLEDVATISLRGR